MAIRPTNNIIAILSLLVALTNNILYGATQEIENLRQKLAGEDYNFKVQVIRELEKIGTSSVPILIDALKDEDSRIRGETARALSKIKDERVVESLIDLLNDRDSFVRRDAIFSLGIQKDKKAIKPLIKAMQDKDILVRRAVIQALGRIGDKEATFTLIDALKDEDVQIRRNVAEAFINISDERAISSLISALKDKDETVRHFSLRALDSFYNKGIIKKDEIIKHLIEAINDSYWNNRVLVVAMLGKTKDKRVIKPLINGLRYECGNIDVLKRIPRKCSFSPPVVETVLWEYVLAFKNLGTLTIPSLSEALKDNNKEFKYHIAVALALIGEKDICPILAETLQSSESGLLRSYAARYLGEFGYKNSIPILKKALQDTDCTPKGYYRVRENAAKALEKLGIKVERKGNKYL